MATTNLRAYLSLRHNTQTNNHIHAMLHVISMQISSLLHKYPSTLHFTQTKTYTTHKMANKLFLVCATLALCFLLTNASIYRTVVEFDEDDDINPGGPQSPKQKCRKEFQQEHHLRACQQWMKKQLRKGGRPSIDDEDIDVEDDIERHPILQQCCHELKQEDPVCVCKTLRRAAKAVRRQEQQQQHGPLAVQKIFKTAKNLPEVCNIPNVDVCPFKAVPSFYY